MILPKGTKFKIRSDWDSEMEDTWYDAGETYTVTKYLPRQDSYNVAEVHGGAWIGVEAIDFNSLVYPSQELLQDTLDSPDTTSALEAQNVSKVNTGDSEAITIEAEYVVKDKGLVLFKGSKEYLLQMRDIINEVIGE